jgi:glycosyltransferase involved in cell wall biosynthesis
LADPPRVLHVVQSWRPITSGYTSRSWHIVQHQLAAGIARPRVLVTSRQTRFGMREITTLPSVDVIICPPSRRDLLLRRLKPSLLDVDALARAIEEAAKDCDVIHTHYSGGIGRAAARAAKRRGVPLVAEVRFDLASSQTFDALGCSLPVIDGILRSYLERYLREAEALVAASYSLARFMTQAFPQIRRAVHVVPNGVAPAARQDGAELRGRLQLDGCFVLGTCGNMLRYENLEAIIDACAHLSNGHALFVGGGPRRLALERHARRCRARATFTGVVPSDQVPAHLAAMDVFGVPRLPTTVTRFASPIKVPEAMAAGKPVVASAVGDVPWLLGHGRGVLTTPGDQSSFNEQVKRLARDPERRAEIGRRACEFALRELSWPAAVNAYRAVYAQALG